MSETIDDQVGEMDGHGIDIAAFCYDYTPSKPEEQHPYFAQDHSEQSRKSTDLFTQRYEA